MNKLVILIISLLLLTSCDSLQCKRGIIQYKANKDNIDDVKGVSVKEYTANLIDTIVPGFKCKFY